MIAEPRSRAISFLEKVDRFLGWLKKPFAKKPAFFIHQFLGLLLIYFIVWRLVITGLYFTQTFYSLSHHSHGLFSELEKRILIFNFIRAFFYAAISVFAFFQLIRFYRFTQTSWVTFNALAFNGLLGIVQSYLVFFYQHTSPEISIHLSPEPLWHPLAKQFVPLLFIVIEFYLFSRKKIMGLHRVRSIYFLYAFLCGFGLLLIDFGMNLIFGVLIHGSIS